MKPPPRYILFTFIMMAVVISAACRGEQKPLPPPAHKAAETSVARCPKLEGSYFGSDKSEIMRGDSIILSWKLPREYADYRIEGLDQAATGIVCGQTVWPAPEFITSSTCKDDLKPQKTMTFVLKAQGPKGCQPLELPATVKVN